MKNKTKTVTVLMVFFVFLSIMGCGFENIIFYKKAEQELMRDASWRAAELQKLQTQVAPYMGKKCKDDIRRLFGEPEDIRTYKPGDKVLYNADEVWVNGIFSKKKKIGWRKFFFKNEVLIAVDVI